MTATDYVKCEIDARQHEFYEREGYLIVRGMLRHDEIVAIRTVFDALAAAGKPIKGHWEPKAIVGTKNALGGPGTADPLDRYPRVMHPHRFLGLAKQFMLDPRIHDVLRTLLGEEPIAAQSMFYFKPPGARGQAMHQDNYYLKVQPGSCVAAWIAIDPSRPDNGGLMVCPGTHKMEVVCPEQADLSTSFVKELVKPPPGFGVAPALMEPGDCLFFNGSLVHGSQPNASRDTWRRSFICHYLPRSARQISRYYFPLYDFAGNEVQDVEADNGGGPCGTEPTRSSYAAWH